MTVYERDLRCGAAEARALSKHRLQKLDGFAAEEVD
jgi:hypothetical protein